MLTVRFLLTIEIIPAMAKRASLRKSKKPSKLGALPEWNLADLYPGMDSPALRRDLDEADTECLAFEQAYKGRPCS